MTDTLLQCWQAVKQGWCLRSFLHVISDDGCTICCQHRCGNRVIHYSHVAGSAVSSLDYCFSSACVFEDYAVLFYIWLFNHCIPESCRTPLTTIKHCLLLLYCIIHVCRWFIVLYADALTYRIIPIDRLLNSFQHRNIDGIWWRCIHIAEQLNMAMFGFSNIVQL